MGYNPVVNPLVLRLFRLVRVLHLFQHWVGIIAPLRLILKSIQSSVIVLLWSMMLIWLTIFVFSTIMVTRLAPFIQDAGVDITLRQNVFEKFGTFTRTFVTMFEVTLANWGPPCFLLMDNIDEAW